MNGEIAQFVALTCHGNAYLTGMSVPRFFPENSTTQFCEIIRFVRLTPSRFGGHNERLVAQSPDSWFSRLRWQGAIGVRLRHLTRSALRFGETTIPERMLAGLVGVGGTWTLEVILDDVKTEWWLARWQTGNTKPRDGRIWKVTYGGIPAANALPPSPDLSAIRARLIDVLRNIKEFAEKQPHTDGFIQCFEKATDSLSSNRRHGHHRDLAPPGLLGHEADAISRRLPERMGIRRYGLMERSRIRRRRPGRI